MVAAAIAKAAATLREFLEPHKGISTIKSHWSRSSLGIPNSSFPRMSVKVEGKKKEERGVDGVAVSRAIQGLGRVSV